MRGDVRRDRARHPRLGIADHQRIDVQRLQSEHGIEHALALDARGQLDFQIHHVRPKAFRGKLERDAGARRGLGEQVGDGAAGEGAADRRAGPERANQALGAIEQPLDQRPRQTLQRDEVAQRAVGAQLLVHAVSGAPLYVR